MKQALHIFAKDVRLYWIEIAATLTVFALFLWIYPSGWRDWPHPLPVYPWVPEITAALIPVSWFVLITRVVHADSLVGDRQFWVTRPYRWPQLLAAKALFLVVLVQVPFFLVQCILLREAGMHPSRYWIGIIFNLIMATGIAILPAASLAAVTSSFPRMLLALLFVLLFISGVAYLDSLLPTRGTSNPTADVLSFVAPVSVFAAVLVVQYARRWTSLSRASLCAVAVLLALFGLFGPEDFMLQAEYPAHSAQKAKLAWRTVPYSRSQANVDSVGEREVTLDLPIRILNSAPQSAITIDEVRASMSTADGERWTSHWQETFVRWLPGQTEGTVPLKVSGSFYAREKDKPVSVEVSFAVTALRPGKATRMMLPRGRFELTGGGICTLSLGGDNDITCLYPMRQPKLTLIATRFSKEGCIGDIPANDGDAGLGWIGTMNPQPAEFGLTSVWESSMYFERLSTSDQAQRRQYICPGSPLSLTEYEVNSREQQRVLANVDALESLAITRF